MSARTVSFNDQGLVVDGEPSVIIAGEVHYWRINPVYWPKVLDRYVEANIGIVSTFICWDAHERVRGSFDFTGATDPALDLGGFLDLAGERGLQVLVRVGPIIDAFWPTRGPAVDVAALERHEELYRTRTEEYFDHLMPVVEPRQVTRGGNVVMVCLDNEVYYPYMTMEGPPAPQPFGKIEVFYREGVVLEKYREWLSNRFGEVRALNEYADTGFASFDVIEAPVYADDSRAMVGLSFEFIDDVIAENFGWLKDEVNRRGIDVPLYCNNRLYTEFIDWTRIDGVIDSSGNQAFTTHMADGEHAYVITWSHMLHRARTKFGWAAEHQAGMCFGLGQSDWTYGLLTPQHFRYAGNLVAALGSRGASLTMFVECDWWHWSPITPVGEVRADYHEAVTDFLDTLRETSADERLADVGLVWDQDGHRTFVSTLNRSWDTLQQLVDSVADPKDFPEWWSTFKLLVDRDVDFDMVVPGAEHAPRPRIWILAGSARIGLSTARVVADHVAGGGTLIVTDRLPDSAYFGNAADDAEVAALIDGIGQSPRVIQLGAGEDLVHRIDDTGATVYARSSTPGVRTYSYRTRNGRDLWVVNTTHAPVDAQIQLDSSMDGYEEFSHNRHVDDATLTPPVATAEGVSLHLPPKTVRAFHLSARAPKGS